MCFLFYRGDRTGYVFKFWHNDECCNGNMFIPILFRILLNRVMDQFECLEKDINFHRIFQCDQNTNENRIKGPLIGIGE